MKRMTTMTLAILLVCGVSRADDYPRNPDVDVIHYAFHLQLSDDTDELRGRATITVQFKAPGITEISFDLVGRAAAGATSGMSVAGIETANGALRFRHTDDRLSVTLAMPSTAGERRTFIIDYSGSPADGLIISENKYGDRTFFGDNWPDRARHWLPTVDHVSDKATVEFIVDAPGQYQVIGNGELLEETDLAGGRRRTHWRSTVPIPTKVMVIGVARFAVQHVGEIDGVPLSSWVYPEDRDAGFYDYAIAGRVLRFFTGHIGPFPYAKLANVQSKTRYGGMENASNIFYNERSVTGDRRREGTVAHEIAHQWFGDSVTEADWHHVWLSEGFATYFTQLYMEFTYGRDRMAAGMQQARSTVLDFFEADPDLAVVAPSITDLNDLLNRNSYQKGGWVLHMLRRQIGDDAFWAGIRDYYRTYRDGNALTDDLQRVMEAASGQDLGWFFDQWVFRPGHPELQGTWSYDAGSRRLTVELAQVQPSGVVFRAPLDIGVRGDDGSAPRIEQVQLDEATEVFTIELDSEPAAVVLDPETWLLFEAEFGRSGVR